MASLVQPVQNRMVVLDVLRGFSLFGILSVNMIDFSGAALRTGTLGLRGTPLDQMVDLAIAFLSVTKFYLLFSFLFGVGFSVQMQRMETSGRPFVKFYLRRLVVLALIGLAHSVLLWSGDILRLYAGAGLLLLLVRHLSTRFLVGLTLLIAVAGLIIFGLAADVRQVSNIMLPEAIVFFTNGTYGDLVRYRMTEHIVFDIQIPMVPVMFLLGLVIGRSGVLNQPERYQKILRRWWKWLLPVGLVGNVVMILGYTNGNPWFVSIGVHIGAPALSFVYLSAVVLNMEKLRWLGPMGQMSLTNYLTQSLICTTLFYGYGFGLYDRLSSTMAFLLVLLIFGLQVVYSSWWMQHFRFGPMEWVWRSLTYGHVQPLRRSFPERGELSSLEGTKKTPSA